MVIKNALCNVLGFPKQNSLLSPDLKKIASEYELDAAKGPIISFDSARHRFKFFEVLPINHGNLVFYV